MTFQSENRLTGILSMPAAGLINVRSTGIKRHTRTTQPSPNRSKSGSILVSECSKVDPGLAKVTLRRPIR